MTSNNGMTIFKKSLSQQPEFKASTKRLCFLNIADPEDEVTNSGYQDDKVITIPAKIPQVETSAFNYYQNFHLVDLFGHLKRSKNKLIDITLAAKKQYQKLLLVTNNQILAYCQANYQVALLDATADYVLNYYLKTSQELEPANNKYTTQCLAFINNDGSYFLALPCICYDYEIIKAKKANQTVIKTTIKTIENLLDQIPLLRTDHISWLRLMYSETNYVKTTTEIANYTSYFYFGYRNQNLNHNYLKKISAYKLNTLATILAKEQEQAKTACQHVLMKTLHIKLWNLPLNYFASHLYLKLKNNLIQVVMWPTNQAYQQILTEIRIHNLTQLATYHFYHGYQIEKYPQLKLAYHALIDDQANKLLNLTSKPQMLIAKSIPMTKSKTVKPLVNSQGLNQVMLNLVNDANKPYYLVNDTLVTLGGNSKISWSRQTKLTN